MNNRDKFINLVLEGCVRNLGYSIQELNIDYAGIISQWILVKKIDEYNHKVILLCYEYYDNKNDQWIIRDLQDNLNIGNMTLAKIFFTNDYQWIENYIKQIDNEPSQDSSEYNFDNIDKSCVILDENGDRIFYYTGDNEEIINLMSYYININANNNSSNVSRKRGLEKATITYIFMGINIFMYIITAILSRNLIDSNVNVLVFLGAKVNPLIDRGQYYRLLTCTFLHGGIVHLGFNMYALYSLGPFVEKVYGKWKYAFIYLVSGIVSSTFSYMFSPSISIGASGSIFGLLGASAVIALKYKDKLGRGFINNIMSVIFINLIIGFSIANVDNLGHIGGLIGGLIISFIFMAGVKE
ncbi:rhomboid family intramembrane serine protease [uncultured Clostridium sp.]|uniref:rhomboid family intramembrane serine protease n=1 Tax=uncultured Clostridium sp. TaxID=59620 RepID=UPI0028E2D49E|nr:rhomboid family intramembrane serine protease [uncultured Clostridium sp.]